MYRYIPLNCTKCGKFVGKDGYHNVQYDYYNGGYDVGESLCKQCLDKEYNTEVIKEFPK